MMPVAAAAPFVHEPPMVIMLPFALLLLSIAVAPLILQRHWEQHYHRLCLGLAAVVFSYYLFARNDSARVLHALFDYSSFIVVVGSFYVVAGGTHLRMRSHAAPAENALFLFCGALLANIVGTIGASMLLIRPWIQMNKARFGGFHLAFFVIIVSNFGGALLPVGPPLFLGYLKGVPFFWPLLHCWRPWLLAIGLLLLVFYFVDGRSSSSSPAASSALAEDRTWHVFGKRNLAIMSILLAALIVLPPLWREGAMLICAVASYRWTKPHVHQANAFTFTPIKEVAWLFLGIFGTMIPVLDYVELHAPDLGVQTDLQFFWATGFLSALLDNAPTYLTFLAGALGLHGFDMNNANQVSEFVARHDHSLVAISLGATFFGALTYIGNGPNLLVKAITQDLKVTTPSFLGFILRTSTVLVPIFILISILFFRR
ncbi:MAG TPA: sodium:proton antiporter [Chthoniobacterales bacterium]|nr:sodium:proton antiporter [Chthoniobacterales bacterium]